MSDIPTLTPRSHLWSYKGAEYEVTIGLAEVHSRFEPVSVMVRALTPRRGRVTNDVLAKVPVARLVALQLEQTLADAVAMMRPVDSAPLQNWTQTKTGEWVPDQTVYDDTARREFWAARNAEAKVDAEKVAQAIKSSGEGSGRRYPKDHLRQVADVYMAALRLRKQPTKAVRERFGLSPAVAARHVARARKQGLIPLTEGKGSTRLVNEEGAE